MGFKLAQNLKRLLNDKGVKSSRLSQESGIDKPTISRMISGKTTNPQFETLRPIAKFFDITIEQLMGDASLPTADSYGIVVPIDRLLIPIIDWKTAQYWLDIKENYVPKKTIDTKNSISNNSYALLIIDKNFEPRFSVGSTIIVDPSMTARNRDYIITRDEKTDETTIRQMLIEKGNNIYLKEITGRKINNDLHITKAKKDLQHFGVIVEAHLDISSAE